MKENKLGLIQIIAVIFICPIIFNSYVHAKLATKPIIITKKIEAQPNNIDDKKIQPIPASRTKKTALRPKSDISNILNTNDEKSIFAVLSNSKALSPQRYNPKGKIDPFEPLFKEKIKRKDGKLEPFNTGRKFKTQLEKIDLSQLKLTGVILSHNGNRGLVEEFSGKGHVIAVGTYVGTRSGEVVSISQDTVIIEEKMQDVYGNIIVQKRELKIVKKSDTI